MKKNKRYVMVLMKQHHDMVLEDTVNTWADRNNFHIISVSFFWEDKELKAVVVFEKFFKE